DLHPLLGRYRQWHGRPRDRLGRFRHADTQRDRLHPATLRGHGVARARPGGRERRGRLDDAGTEQQENARVERHGDEHGCPPYPLPALIELRVPATRVHFHRVPSAASKVRTTHPIVAPAGPFPVPAAAAPCAPWFTTW